MDPGSRKRKRSESSTNEKQTSLLLEFLPAVLCALVWDYLKHEFLQDRIPVHVQLTIDQSAYITRAVCLTYRSPLEFRLSATRHVRVSGPDGESRQGLDDCPLVRRDSGLEWRPNRIGSMSFLGTIGNTQRVDHYWSDVWGWNRIDISRENRDFYSQCWSQFNWFTFGPDEKGGRILAGPWMVKSCVYGSAYFWPDALEIKRLDSDSHRPPVLIQDVLTVKTEVWILTGEREILLKDNAADDFTADDGKIRYKGVRLVWSYRDCQSCEPLCFCADPEGAHLYVLVQDQHRIYVDVIPTEPALVS